MARQKHLRAVALILSLSSAVASGQAPKEGWTSLPSLPDANSGLVLFNSIQAPSVERRLNALEDSRSRFMSAADAAQSEVEAAEASAARARERTLQLEAKLEKERSDYESQWKLKQAVQFKRRDDLDRLEASVQGAIQATSEAEARVESATSTLRAVERELRDTESLIRAAHASAEDHLPPSVVRKILPFEGAVVRDNALIVGFAHGTPPDRVRRILDAHGLRLLAGLLEERLFLVGLDRVHGSDYERAVLLADSIERLESEVDVAVATLDPFLAARQAVSGRAVSEECDAISLLRDWDWTRLDSLKCAAPLIRLRFPAAWELVDKYSPVVNVRVGVFDSGFEEHDDLDFSPSGDCGRSPHSHGTGVLSVIASAWNGIGICGALRRASVVTCQPPSMSSTSEASPYDERKFSLFAAVVKLRDFILVDEPRVVNFSLGFNWYQVAGSSPIDMRKVRALSSDAGAVVRQLFERDLRKAVLVSAAGNDSSDSFVLGAEFGSPLNYVRHRYPESFPSIVTVGSLRFDERLSVFSNRSAEVTAFGESIPVYRGGKLHLERGTSFAAPFVTAIAALVAMANPGLSAPEIAAIVRSSAGPGGRADALEAVVAAMPREVALRLLADLNSDGRVDQGDVDSLIAAVETGAAMQPALDPNGDGLPSVERGVRSRVGGDLLSDPEVIERAWSDSGAVPQWNQ